MNDHSTTARQASVNEGVYREQLIVNVAPEIGPLDSKQVFVDYVSLFEVLLMSAAALRRVSDVGRAAPWNVESGSYDARVELLRKRLDLSEENLAKLQRVDDFDKVLDIVAPADDVPRAHNRPAGFIDDYFTVGIKGTRQSGKTRAIRNLAHAGDLIICFNKDAIANITSRMRPYQRDLVTSGRIAVRSSSDLRYWVREGDSLHGSARRAVTLAPGFWPTRIFVDDASAVYEHRVGRKDFLAWVGRTFPQTPEIIEVG